MTTKVHIILESDADHEQVTQNLIDAGVTDVNHDRVKKHGIVTGNVDDMEFLRTFDGVEGFGPDGEMTTQ